MRIKFPVLLSTAVCLTFGSLSNAEETYGCPTIKPKRMCCCCIVKPRPKPRPYIELGVGQALNARVNSGTYPFFSPDNPEQVVGNTTLSQESRALPTNVLLGAGWVWRELYAKDPVYLPYLSLGLQYQYTNLNSKKSTLRLAGQPIDPETGEPGEEQSANAPFDLSQMSLLGVAKLDLYQWRNVMPYISLGVGASRNHAKQKGPFISNADGAVIGADQVASSKRNTAFSYMVGAGLDFPINNNFWLSLGYHYNNFGRVKVGNLPLVGIEAADVANPNQSFNLGSFNTHTIQLTGRYVFA